MAITTQDGLVAAVAAAQLGTFYKASLANTVAGQQFSLWQAAGLPAPGATPAAAATCLDSTVGGFLFNNATANYLGRLSAQMVNAGSLIVYDRLQAMGGLSGTVTTAQTVNVAIPASRNADYSNVEWFLEWYTATGATVVNITVTYVDQADQTRTVVIATTATMRAARLVPIPPNAGQLIKSVTSLQLSATTGTAGSFGVTVARRYAACPVAVTHQITVLDAFNLGLPVLPNDACLWLTMLCSTTTTGILNGDLAILGG